MKTIRYALYANKLTAEIDFSTNSWLSKFHNKEVLFTYFFREKKLRPPFSQKKSFSPPPLSSVGFKCIRPQKYYLAKFSTLNPNNPKN